MAQTVKDVLVAARELIAVPERWTQNALARDAGGRMRSAESRGAVSWCAYGALIRQAGGPTTATVAAADKLSVAASAINPKQYRGQDSFLTLNNKSDHPTVLRMFDLAIAEADASPAGRL